MCRSRDSGRQTCDESDEENQAYKGGRTGTCDGLPKPDLTLPDQNMIRFIPAMDAYDVCVDVLLSLTHPGVYSVPTVRVSPSFQRCHRARLQSAHRAFELCLGSHHVTTFLVSDRRCHSTSGRVNGSTSLPIRGKDRVMQLVPSGMNAQTASPCRLSRGTRIVQGFPSMPSTRNRRRTRVVSSVTRNGPRTQGVLDSPRRAGGVSDE
jgi:hypothetical protein